MLQTITHYSLHFLVIAGIAWWYDRENWIKIWGILMATMLVDLDHLIADPVFDPSRCSIGFHVLHQEYFAILYFAGAFIVKRSVLRVVFIGLAFHMVTDLIDCFWMALECTHCRLPSFLR